MDTQCQAVKLPLTIDSDPRADCPLQTARCQSLKITLCKIAASNCASPLREFVTKQSGSCLGIAALSVPVIPVQWLFALDRQPVQRIHRPL